MEQLRIRRALITVSDKTGVVELARALADSGAELVATGRTATVLRDAGLRITPIEHVSGSPEAFQGRMKTLSFPVCSGLLYRRGDASDEADLKKLGIVPIDCVVVNFYPFEEAAAKRGERRALIEEVDIGGPTLVRSAAKNAPDTLVLTSPAQYARVERELRESRSVRAETALACASEAWERVLEYDRAIASELGKRSRLELRYGENPHQKAHLEFDPEGPIAWGANLAPQELSYNNILDLSAAYALAADLREVSPDCTSVVIVKHNNPCGVASVPRAHDSAQRVALARAWEGDPTSAFGGVLVFTDPLSEDAGAWLAERFVEVLAAPGLRAEDPGLRAILARRKNLKGAIAIRGFDGVPAATEVAVPGGVLRQTTDTGLADPLRAVTRAQWPVERARLARFGIAVCRALKSNSIALVRDLHGVLQLVGAGQGQPNRIDALNRLAIPRAQGVLRATEGALADCVMVSDAFFPFRDTVDAAHAGGIRFIVQPGGSVKDAESVAACDEHGIAMAFTGVRHFRH